MQLCIINNPKFNKSGSKDALARLETITVKQFLKASDLPGDGWLSKCPYPGCGCALRVALTNEQTGEYSVWCEECGWTPADGFDPVSPYLTIQEAANALRLAPVTVETLVKSGMIGATNFTRNTYSDFRIPRSLVNAIVASRGSWTFYMGVVG